VIVVLAMQESVALMLKQPALIGLDAAELRERLQGLADAVGCERSKAARLASHTASLIMMHPDYIKVGDWLLAHASSMQQGWLISLGANTTRWCSLLVAQLHHDTPCLHVGANRSCDSAVHLLYIIDWLAAGCKACACASCQLGPRLALLPRWCS
jgi:hypothetical protein